jgi:hypothetical protein
MVPFWKKLPKPAPMLNIVSGLYHHHSGLLLIASGSGILTILSLSIMPLFNIAKTMTELYFEYAAYCILLLIFVHAAIFWFALPKNTGRYLEYMYVLVISVSLAQIFFSNQALSHYLEYIYGDQQCF